MEMRICRAPVRISFSGGGTDLKAYYGTRGGAVVSATIDRYVYALSAPDGCIESYYWEDGCWQRQEKTLFLRQAMDHLGLRGTRIAAQVPPGTGLGSSGAMLVALVKMKNPSLLPLSTASIACDIEIERMRMPVGKQDQYAAAHGGLNLIRFRQDETVTVEPIMLPLANWKALESRLMLFYLGSTHTSYDLLSNQQRATEQGLGVTVENLDRLKSTAFEIRDALRAGDLDDVGELLDCSWRCKRLIVRGITNRIVDRFYMWARKAGAIGGKLTGAGGGGHLLLYCHKEKQHEVTRVLQRLGAEKLEFKLDFEGAKCLNG